ncbi:hypothetical protein F5882DRAFT_414217 [Hyaloscypha sp. PMI_1271]|nr:hypothetical protein F5882DRAFT_414217 [Hyaloscypha sp. PMI_1271]
MTLEEGFNNKTIFMEWRNSEVIKTEPETCSDSLLFYPGIWLYRIIETCIWNHRPFQRGNLQ